MPSTLLPTAKPAPARALSPARAPGRLQSPRLQNLFLVAVLLVNCVVAREGLLSQDAVRAFTARYGGPATERLHAWERLLLATRDAAEHDKLEEVNRYFNGIPWLSDDEHWGRRDYWATPLEMIGTFGGDCEDYSIAKYISLVKIGVDPSRLRITYVRAPRLRQPHMVLAYYPAPDAEPLILDNLDPVIRPAGQRRDLIPVYSFNTAGLWTTEVSGAPRRVGGASRLAAWREVSQRMRDEGLEESG